MSSLVDLARLLNLRKRREEGARAAVSIAAARLRDAERAMAIADEQIDLHERAAAEQELRFLVAMGIRPIGENELGRSRDLFGISNQKHQALIVSRDVAQQTVAQRAADLAAAKAQCRTCVFEFDRLAEAERKLQQQVRRQRDAAGELEAEEMSSDRVSMSW